MLSNYHFLCGRYLNRYTRRSATVYQHHQRIREHYGYQDFHDPRVQAPFQKFLRSRSYLTAEPLTSLFDLATGWLIGERVQLPAVTTMVRLIASIKEEADEKLYQDIVQDLGEVQIHQLRNILHVQESTHSTPYDELRRAPTRDSAGGMVMALNRVKGIRESVPFPLTLPPGLPLRRVKMLANYGLNSKSKYLLRMPTVRGTAILRLSLNQLEKEAVDDCLEIFDQIMAKVLGKLEREYVQDRLKNLPSLDQASQTMKKILALLLDESITSLEDLKLAAFKIASKERLTEVLEAVTLLTQTQEDRKLEDIQRRYSYVRHFLPLMMTTIPFQATSSGKKVLEAWQALGRLEGRKKVDLREVPTDLLDRQWKSKLKNEDGTLNRAAYTLGVLEHLWESLSKREIFVETSVRYTDPTAKLLSPADWEKQRIEVCQSLNLSPDADTFISGISEDLHLHYLFVAGRVKKNASLVLQDSEDQKSVRPHLEKLDAFIEPDSLKWLRAEVKKLLPKVDLPELLLEVHSWTGFLSMFTHISEGNSRVTDLLISICAVLTSEACNIGFEPVSHQSHPALTKDRLSWVNQNYVRVETISEANARLVNFQKDIPLAQEWGGLASVDGLRFKVPVRSIHARANPKYFGHGSGVTWLNYVSDYGTGFHGIVIPGTMRDSLFVLDGLLEQNTELQPKRITSDTHGYSDIVFGLYRLLGYQFSPRLADLTDQRFWRVDREADYGALNKLARHKVNTELIREHWDEILRVVGSLTSRTVKASEILRVLQRKGKPNKLGRAIGEIGRMAKSIHLLQYLDDESYRREIREQLNLHESRHALAREVFHGKRGELRQAYKAGQEDQLGALGLVVNAICLWNTKYTGVALKHLEEQGVTVLKEDVERLSPFMREHINLLGRYHFEVPEVVKQGLLRPLMIEEDDFE
ncbi:Tn3 family transposase [Deinococcus roseus]|uniref:Transposase n=1 Tax=Deinococcus roseus TaxID=392414 RepID=A0ABQ2DKP2_9DEIO|nr:Tn3 family transposase [Deinococcus roseus]GGJ58600.1 transposase [Deinococcus roseus]